MRSFLSTALVRVLIGVFVLPAVFPNANAGTIQYTYDALGRLVNSSQDNGQTMAYSYDAAGNRSQVNQTAAAAPTVTFAASPSAIAQGSATTLAWSATNVTSVSIDHGVGVVSPASGGSVNVSPSSTTTYTLTLTNAAGSTATYQTTVTVTPMFSATVTVPELGPDLFSLADSTGYNGSVAATIKVVVENGVTITGTADGAAGGGGGNGGGPGSSAGNENSGTSGSGGSGGTAGYAIRKNGNAVGVTNNGTIAGTQG
jgi:YD repeat-containing protein